MSRRGISETLTSAKLSRKIAWHSGRGEDGWTPAFEGERGDEARTVDLGSRQEGVAPVAVEGGIEVGTKRRPGNGQ